MAEIEFKRRGTPLWAVVLVLVVVVALVYVLFGRSGGGNGSGVADSVAAATPAPPPPAPAGTPGGTTAPPASRGAPVAAFGNWVNGMSLPGAGEPQRAILAEGLRLLAAALEERMPMSGVQILLVRGMADTLMLPNPTENQQINAVQAAFFGAAYAMRETPVGESMNKTASALQLTKTVTEQRAEIRKFFEAARDALRDPNRSPRPAAPATKS